MNKQETQDDSAPGRVTVTCVVSQEPRRGDSTVTVRSDAELTAEVVGEVVVGLERIRAKLNGLQNLVALRNAIVAAEDVGRATQAALISSDS